MDKVKQLSNVYNWFTGDKVTTTIGQLSDNQILNIANDINGLFSETNLIESKPELSLPKLVVIGCQSAGKSSVLNSIISMDILPTGKNMVTRTPLELQLHQLTQDSKDGWVEFGQYNQNGWTSEKKIPITTPIPTETEIKNVRDYISAKTIELAGDGMNISHIPIMMNIYSPNVPNLSLVDLPGLTVIPCVDKGQPVDIKEKIEELVASYIKQERTIVLAVMQSRNDLETDIGLGLIKKYDNGNQRIIGVLTKPDLMNQETHIGEYLINNISKNLMLTYGYYVVKNRAGIQGSMDVFKGYELEKEYFNSHFEYKKIIYKDRIGTDNLTKNLSKILISSITELLPSVMSELGIFEGKINAKLESMGNEIPETKEGKLSFMNKYISNFNYKFIDSIESRGNSLNTGKLIKDTFITYRTELNQIKPFNDKKIYTPDYFKSIVASFEGNHMSFHIPPIQILEACMTDQRYKPIFTLQSKSLKCVDSICELLIGLIRNITMQEEFSQFPQLASYIMSSLIDEIISKTKNETKQQINKLLQNEHDYIWTENKEFLEMLSKVNGNMDNINEFLEGYFCSVKNIVSHSVPKIIMTGIIREVENNTLSFMLHNIVCEDKILLLKQDEEIEKQRNYYNDLKTRILTIRRSFSKIK
ncbi:dynamin family protein [Indivirus ILV1]|uniref:Dynamin family protein n=1 Tax=Indivirus ILV1 TaxID=1977633 RepID=A0A1V0SCX6_9VIRU|nr:dynamin family protein [Indivirus ILV1]